MTVVVDIEETATIPNTDDVSFSHCDGSSVTVALRFRDSGHREIASALGPNLLFHIYYTSSKGIAEKTIKGLKTRVQYPDTKAS